MSNYLLEGLRVIDLGSWVAGPAAATILGDLGADVIKIEPPGIGDPYRYINYIPDAPQADDNYAWLLTSVLRVRAPFPSVSVRARYLTVPPW